MTSNTHSETDRAVHRAAIERVIAHYPEISDDELHDLLHYFRRDASAYDRAIIASNAQIVDRYRQLCHDHSLDRLGRVETLVVVIFAILLLVGVAFFTLGDWQL